MYSNNANRILLGRARRLSAIATWATADSFMRSLGRPGDLSVVALAKSEGRDPGFSLWIYKKVFEYLIWLCLIVICGDEFLKK